jgi:type II secretory pathway pseudopilin PulG
MRDDRGETLLELLIALTILGVAVVAVVGGLSAAIMLSDVHRKQATAGVAVRDYAEAVETAIVTSRVTADGHVTTDGYVACGGAENPAAVYASPTGFAAPTGFTRSAVAGSLRYWNGTAWQATCPGTGDTGLQRLTLQVASNDGRATERLDVVIRKPCRLIESLCN